MGGGQGARHPPDQRSRALHTTIATVTKWPHQLHQPQSEAGGTLPPREPAPTSGERCLTSIDHAHCRAENRALLLAPRERHPAFVRSGTVTTTALCLARGFPTRHYSQHTITDVVSKTRTTGRTLRLAQQIQLMACSRLQLHVCQRLMRSHRAVFPNFALLRRPARDRCAEGPERRQ
jgi:hypothetical protein